MKKLINAPETALMESLEGFVQQHEDRLVLNREPAFIKRADAPVRGKVALVSGGGSGHEPLHGGFVGPGMLDAACPGQMFTSPTPDQPQAAAEAVDGGHGVLFVVKNYTGDVMNFEMAAEMIEAPNETVLVNDDVAVEDSSFTSGRRGVAGTLVVEKVLGAAADAGQDLKALKTLGDRVNQQTGSMGVAIRPCTVPTAGKPTFDLPEDEMEIGIGIHGEPGRRREKLAGADQIAQELIGAVLEDLKPDRGQRVLLLVNGMGATPMMELTLMYGAARRALEPHGLEVVRSLVGNYVTSLDMAGCQLTVTLVDDEMLKFWDAPANTPALRWGV